MSSNKAIRVTPEYIKRLIEEEKTLVYDRSKYVRKNQRARLEEREILRRVIAAELRARFFEEHPELINEAWQDVMGNLGTAVGDAASAGWGQVTDWFSNLTPAGVIDAVGDPLVQTLKKDLADYVLGTMMMPPGPLRAVIANIFEQIPISQYYVIYKDWDGQGCTLLTGYIVDGTIEALVLEPMVGALQDAMAQAVGIFAVFDQYGRSPRMLKEYLNGIIQQTDLYTGFSQEVEMKVCGITQEDIDGIVYNIAPSLSTIFGISAPPEAEHGEAGADVSVDTTSP